uniref:CSON012981 protein n=1 Tax=Culicoides sonorensis TaxID=179676 RepID=A0A336K4U4_CULSO
MYPRRSRTSNDISDSKFVVLFEREFREEVSIFNLRLEATDKMFKNFVSFALYVTFLLHSVAEPFPEEPVGTCSLQSGELLPDEKCYDNCKDSPDQRHFLTCIEMSCYCRIANPVNAIQLNAASLPETTMNMANVTSTSFPVTTLKPVQNDNTIAAEQKSKTLGSDEESNVTNNPGIDINNSDKQENITLENSSSIISSDTNGTYTTLKPNLKQNSK